MTVAVVRGGHGARRRVERLAEVQAGGPVRRLRERSLVAGPSEVRAGNAAVDLFPRVPSDFPEVELVPCGIDRVSERIPDAVNPDLRPDRVRSIVERVVSRSRSIVVHAQDLSFPVVQVLRSQGQHISVGTVADSQQQLAIGAEPDGPDGVRSAVGADAVGSRGIAGARRNPDAAKDDGITAGQCDIGIGWIGRDPHKTRCPGRRTVGARRVFVGVAEIHVSVVGEIRMKRDTPHPAVVERVHFGAQIDEGRL